ncbi:MAG: A24 family peptidase [Myxococcota bacterium]
MLRTYDPTTEYTAFAAAILIAAVAALFDFRQGRIPNWLTLPPLIIAPIAYGLVHGLAGAAMSIGGIVLCGLVPWLLFRQGAIGGGDVKMTAAIGAVTGVLLGLKIEFVSLLVAGIYALGRLAWEGQLLRTLGNSFFLAANPLLPKHWRRSITPTMLATVRMGGAFVAAAILSFISEHPELLR